MVGLDPMYIPVVKGHLDTYIGRKKDDRAAIVGLAVLEIQKMAEEKGVEPPLFAQKVCDVLHHHWLLTIFLAESGDLVPKSPSSQEESTAQDTHC
jgi:hypothetical protein